MGDARCETPEWKHTRKGSVRCGRICVDGNGKRRFRWVKGEACGDSKPSPLSPSPAGTTQLPPVDLGVPLVELEPMPLVPFAQMSDLLVGSDRGRKM